MNHMRGGGPRFIEPELLDDAPEEAARQSLRDLARINRWLGGHRVARQLVGSFAAPDEPFTVLDVGSGSGDMGEAIRRAFPHALVTSADRDALHVSLAPAPRVVADAFALPFPEQSFDFVFCSLF